MEDKTKNQNIFLKEMINSSWSGMGIVNLDTKFIFTNNAFSPLLGYTNDELMQLKFIDLVSSENQVLFQELIENNAKNKYVNNIQLSCKRKDGGLIFLDVTINLMKDSKYIVLDVSDITQTIAEHEIFNKYLVQTQIDTNGNITKASEAYCRLSGYSESELIGMPYNNEKNNKKYSWSDIKNSKEYSGTIGNTTKTGNFFWVECVIKPKYNKYGDITGYTSVMFDITNEMTLEEKKKDLLQQIVDRDEKLNIMTSTMRLVAHEWRQPLNTISLEVQNLMLKYQFGEDIESEETVEYLTSVTEHIEELSAVINNFQNTTEIKESKVETSSKIIIKKSIESSLVQINHIQFEDTTTQSFSTYQHSLSQSIAHILNNAHEAIERSKDKDSKISIKTYQDENNTIFEISNIGNHIPEDIIDNIFTPYFSTKEIRNGVGLSLYNCKTIIELHLKGHIEVFNISKDENNAEETVMFRIILPLNY